MHFFVKGQDRAPWTNAGVVSAGLDAQAVKDGVTVPAPTWTGCGTWGGVAYGRSDYTACETWGASATLIVENYYQLRAAVNAGYTGTAMYDLEPWSYTPYYQYSDPAKWLTRAAQFARYRGIRLIETTGGRLVTLQLAEVAVSAGADAFMVAFQSQGRFRDTSTQTEWDTKVSTWVRALRAARAKAGTSTLLMAGLATNTNTHLYDYSKLDAQYTWLTRHVAISNVWLNANNWGTADRCHTVAGSGGPGCPEYGVQLLHHALPDTAP